MTKRFCDKCGAEADAGVLLIGWAMATYEYTVDAYLKSTGHSNATVKPYDLCESCAKAIKEALPG